MAQSCATALPALPGARPTSGQLLASFPLFVLARSAEAMIESTVGPLTPRTAAMRYLDHPAARAVMTASRRRCPACRARITSACASVSSRSMSESFMRLSIHRLTYIHQYVYGAVMRERQTWLTGWAAQPGEHLPGARGTGPGHRQKILRGPDQPDPASGARTMSFDERVPRGPCAALCLPSTVAMGALTIGDPVSVMGDTNTAYQRERTCRLRAQASRAALHLVLGARSGARPDTRMARKRRRSFT